MNRTVAAERHQFNSLANQIESNPVKSNQRRRGELIESPQLDFIVSKRRPLRRQNGGNN